jgi:hypothetical protein
VSSSFQRELKDAFDDVADSGAKPPPRPQLTALDGGAGPPRTTADGAPLVDAEVPAAIADAAPEGLLADPRADDVVVDAAPESVMLEQPPHPVVDQEAGGRRDS